MRSLGFDSESALSVNIGTERFLRRQEEGGPGGPRAPVGRAAPPRLHSGVGASAGAGGASWMGRGALPEAPKSPRSSFFI